MRISGIGTAYLGFGPRDADGQRTATSWFTFFYLPIKPLRRGSAPWWTTPAVLLGAIWPIAAAWKLADWHDARAEPTPPPKARAF